MDQQCFKEMVFILRDELYRFAKRFLISGDEAEDVVQELMLKFWQTRNELAKYNNLKAFAMKAVRNECLNRLKHHEVKQQYRNNFSATQSDQLPAESLKEQIIAFINQLPTKQRMVIHLRDVEKYEIAEIAEVLEMAENAVRANLTRARQTVREQISSFMEMEKRAVERLSQI